MELEIGNEFVAPRPFLGTAEKPISIGDLTNLIKAKLEGNFFEVFISGEISNFKPHSSGHFYFSLKDESASISAVMFRGANAGIKFKPTDGLKVIACGKITVYPPRGNYQIVLSRMEPEGLGALQLAFEQLKIKLKGEGLFDEARKRRIPKFPRKVGIVTSPTGAAIRDMLNILGRRFAGLHVLINPVKVQGDGSANEIAKAIKEFNTHFSEIDVLIVGRGGGSIEDLWAFNEEVVARAIFTSQIPVISAVGHEIDFTIADFVADLRAPTPSAAAELVAADRLETLRHLEHLTKRLRSVERKLEFLGMKFDDLRTRLESSVTNLLREIRHRIEKAGQSVKLLNPTSILERGYSIVRSEKSGKIIKKAADVRLGETLLIELSKGKIRARV